ncbi:hypothetical protein F5Y15DRAFT_369564 [Xylariaceae sp. FL0016]|nr:hypothetical protein F5Y15DRAFT_369564 [Xylariaceae sp. FL0016]
MVFVPLTTTLTSGALAPRQTTSAPHDGTPPVAALTTIFTPSSGCWPITDDETSDIDTFWTTYTSCAPPGYASYWSTFYYSPAICPSGYSIGCSRYTDQGPPVEATETAMLCVVSGYECDPEDWNFYATNSENGGSQAMIEIRWAESDISTLETHPLTPGLKPVSTSPIDGDATSSALPTVTVVGDNGNDDGNGSDGDGSGGLSQGARIGIGVGVGLAGLLALAIAAFFIWRHRQKKTGKSLASSDQPSVQQQPQQSSPPGQYPVYQYPYMPGPEHGSPSPPTQVYAQIPQGYAQPANTGYTSYVDPKTGHVSYYSPVPQPTELGGTAIEGPHSQGTPSVTPSVVGSPPTNHHESTHGPNSVSYQTNEGGHASPQPSTGFAEMPGSEGVARSADGSENPQAQQELATLMAEQAKLDARRTRLMEMAELDEEEKRIKMRMQQLQNAQ